MLSRSDENTLSDCTWLFIIMLTIGSILIFINPVFDVFDMQTYLVLKLVLITFFIISRFYFSLSNKLGFKFLVWQLVMFIATIALLLVGYIQMWLSASLDIWGVVFIISMTTIFSLMGFFIRILDPNSNFETSTNKGRFSMHTFDFEPSVWLPVEPSKNNPVLLKLGLKKNNSLTSFENTVRKGGVYSAILIPMGGLSTFFNLSEFFYLVVMTAWLVCMGYIVASNFIFDLYYCLKAGFTTKQSI